MLSSVQFWVVTAVAAVACAFTAVNAVIFNANRGRQAEILERQTFVQQSAQLETLYREIVQALAQLAARDGDKALETLLADQGITITITPPSAAEAAPPQTGNSR